MHKERKNEGLISLESMT